MFGFGISSFPARFWGIENLFRSEVLVIDLSSIKKWKISKEFSHMTLSHAVESVSLTTKKKGGTYL